MAKYTETCLQCSKPFMAGSGQKHCSQDCRRADPAHVELVKGRFWAKVEKGDGCWIWQGSRSSAFNYPTFNYFGHIIHAHRAIWQLLYGALPGRHVHVLHRCNNGAGGCVRPDHLYLGTDRENTADKVKAGRHTFGERSPRAKLTEEIVRQIRREFKGGHRGRKGRGNSRELAMRYGVKAAAIVNAYYGHTWSHIPRD